MAESAERFKQELRERAQEGPEVLESYLGENEGAMAQRLAGEGPELAKVLSLAAARASAGWMDRSEAEMIAKSLAGQPALLAKLLTGMGA
jgi:hypothetical protein